MQSIEKLSNFFFLPLTLSLSKYWIGPLEKNSFRNAEEPYQNSLRTRTRQGLKISSFSQQVTPQTWLNVMCKVTGVNVTIKTNWDSSNTERDTCGFTVYLGLGRKVDFWSCLPEYCVCTKVCQSNFGDRFKWSISMCLQSHCKFKLHSKHSLKMG